MKKFIKYIILIFLVIFTLFLILTNGGIAHQLSNAKGFSYSIKESKERGTFIKELDYLIVPDSIKLVLGKKFYVEKGFRYGNFSSASIRKNTKLLNGSDDYSYQVCVSPSSGKNFIGEYLLKGGDNWLFHKMKDTIKSEIVTKVPHYDSIYKVGELILFDKKDKSK